MKKQSTYGIFPKHLLRAGSLALFCALAFPLVAAAETAVPKPGESLGGSKPPKQNVSLENVDKGTGKQGAESVRFTLTEIRVEHDGIKVKDEKIDAITRKIIGKEIDAEELNGAIGNVTRYIRAHGYPAAAAYIPEQTAVGGKLLVKVEPGRLGSIHLSNESKLKEDSNLIKGDVSILQASNAGLNKKVLGIQKEMDENSRNYALEKEKILGEIEGLKEQGEGFRPAINNLNNRLANLTKAHDLTKNSLLEKMKSLEQSNQTRFEEIETKNEDFKNRYNKNTEQLQRDLGFVRAGIDARDRDIEHLANETVQAREAFGRLEKQSNVKFKTLFDYNAYTNRQIKKQERNKLTTLGNIRKAAQPDLVKKAFAGLIRGRFFDAQPILS